MHHFLTLAVISVNFEANKLGKLKFPSSAHPSKILTIIYYETCNIFWQNPLFIGCPKLYHPDPDVLDIEGQGVHIVHLEITEKQTVKVTRLWTSAFSELHISLTQSKYEERHSIRFYSWNRLKSIMMLMYVTRS